MGGRATTDGREPERLPDALVYADQTEPGYGRRRHGRGFVFLTPEGERLADGPELERCRGLAIPPAWEKVWICRLENGHILCTGNDARERKQYRYHPLWNAWRSREKFAGLTRFARRLHRVRDAVEHDLRRRRLTRRRVVAAAVRLIDRGLVRVGNEAYARDNESFGATTLRERHVEVEDGEIVLDFTGKSSSERRLELEDPALARSLRDCQELPGQRLFRYRDADGEPRDVDSADVNDYLRDASGLDDVSAKDFRTWGGTVAAWQHAHAHRDDGAKNPALAAVRHVAATLGNTVAVARRYYVHPALLEAIAAGETPPRARGRRKHMDSSETTVARFLESL